IPKIHEFEYEIQFESEAMKSKLESCVALYMIEKSYDIMAKRITFIFNLVFTPKKPLRNPEPFTAHFLPGSDLEFFVKPQAGELLPFNTN
ncbi:CFAP47 isoform 3, partial [Pan troglodytes]